MPDPSEAAMLADLDDHLATLPMLARLFVGEYDALTAEGMPALPAAILVAHRWRPLS